MEADRISLFKKQKKTHFYVLSNKLPWSHHNLVCLEKQPKTSKEVVSYYTLIALKSLKLYSSLLVLTPQIFIASPKN